MGRTQEGGEQLVLVQDWHLPIPKGVFMGVSSQLDIGSRQVLGLSSRVQMVPGIPWVGVCLVHVNQVPPLTQNLCPVVWSSSWEKAAGTITPTCVLTGELNGVGVGVLY